MSFSKFLKKKVLDHINNVTPYSAPGAIYMALYKTDPGDTNTGTEVSAAIDDTAYERQAITFLEADAGTCIAPSSNDQTYDATVYGSGESQYIVTHVAFFDADTGGHELEFTQLPAPITRTTGKTLVFAAGAVTSNILAQA
jgi:hypothetical protein